MSVRTTWSCRRVWLADGAVVAVLVVGWIGCAYAVTGGQRTALYDTFREMAWAENMRAGRIWDDPVLLGESYWYAPGNPLLMAAIASATGLPPSVSIAPPHVSGT